MVVVVMPPGALLVVRGVVDPLLRAPAPTVRALVFYVDAPPQRDGEGILVGELVSEVAGVAEEGEIVVVVVVEVVIERAGPRQALPVVVLLVEGVGAAPVVWPGGGGGGGESVQRDVGWLAGGGGADVERNLGGWRDCGGASPSSSQVCRRWDRRR